MPIIFAAMTTLSYIIWNANPEIFTLPIPFIDKELTLRWYGLFFALGFLITQQIMYYIFKKEGKPEKDVDTITIYMVVATIVGARLGHVLFYEPEKYLEHPLNILKVWEGGLASHGGAIGILFALWLYSRKKVNIMSSDGKSVLKVDRRPNQNYLQTLDRIVIMCALVGCLIRFGNLMNSEIIGKPTESSYGVVFARNVTEVLKSDGSVKSVQYSKNDSLPANGSLQPIKILLEFEKNETTNYDTYHRYIRGSVENELNTNPYIQEHVIQTGPLDYKLIQDETGTFYGIINTYAVPRHPGQLYESISCLLLFVLLFWIWSKHKLALPEGRLFGIFLIVCFGLRIVWELFKINQVDFEDSMALNMGQILSIPLVLAGFYFLIRSYRKPKTQ
jgi:phosphatidylglycerol:prolipoprotein diacylglycerol transferase